MTAILRGFTIRPAQKQDVPRLVELDSHCFGSDGVVPYGQSHFECWLDVNPEGLLVACKDGTIVAYRYSQTVDFTIDDIARLTTNDAFTDCGFTRSTHKPNGNSINGVSVCSTEPGAAKLLFETVFDQLVKTGRRYEFGFARIIDFDAYCQDLEQSGLDLKAFDLEVVARWYALQCAAMVSGKVWEWVQPLSLHLPPPKKPDRVLGKYLRHKGLGIAAILPNWMIDPRSRDFGVMMLFKNPHLD